MITFFAGQHPEHQAYDAVNSGETHCASGGLNIACELDGTEHYGGYVNRDENGDYSLMDTRGYGWSDGCAWSGSYTARGGYGSSAAVTSINGWVPDA